MQEPSFWTSLLSEYLSSLIVAVTVVLAAWAYFKVDAKNKRRRLAHLGIKYGKTRTVLIALSRHRVDHPTIGEDGREHTFRGYTVSEQEFSAAVSLQRFIKDTFAPSNAGIVDRILQLLSIPRESIEVEIGIFEPTTESKSGVTVICLGSDVYNKYTSHVFSKYRSHIHGIVAIDENGSELTIQDERDGREPKRLQIDLTDQYPEAPRVRRITRPTDGDPTIWGREVCEEEQARSGLGRDLALYQVVPFDKNGPDKVVLIAGLGGAGTQAATEFLIENAHHISQYAKKNGENLDHLVLAWYVDKQTDGKPDYETSVDHGRISVLSPRRFDEQTHRTPKVAHPTLLNGKNVRNVASEEQTPNITTSAG